jgi:phosphate transport system permease protein
VIQHNNRRYLFRRTLNVFNLSMSMLATLFGLFWLGWLLWTLVGHGLQSINLELFTKDTPPPGAPGGMANAMIGSL